MRRKKPQVMYVKVRIIKKMMSNRSADDTEMILTSKGNERTVQDAEVNAESGAELATNVSIPKQNDDNLEVHGEFAEIENGEGSFNQETGKMDNFLLFRDMTGYNKSNLNRDYENLC